MGTPEAPAVEHADMAAPYRWQVRLWSNDPRRLYGILFSCAMAALVGWIGFHQVLFALVGFCAIAFATAEYWMPQSYRLDANGATARCGLSVSSIAWRDVKRLIPDAEGVKLSPLEKDGRMSAFRGVYLRFGDQKEEVLRRVEGCAGGAHV